MSKPTNIPVLLRHTLALIAKRVFVVFLVLVTLTSVYSITRAGTQHVQAASPATLNFQARLLNSSGSLVPDGIYNVEFKIFNASTSSGSSQGSCTGDANCLWTETRLSSDPSNQQIEVKNGYLSAYLGDKTSLPTNIWNQQLWLTMNIGGVGLATWDGEMTPRIRLTSVPFAFRATVADSAETLQKNTGSFTGTVDFATMTADRKFLFPDTSLATTASPGTICVFNGSVSNCPAATGSAYYIHNDTGLQTQSNFNIQAKDSGVNGTAAGVFRGADAGQTVDLVEYQATNGTVLGSVTAAGNLKVAASVDTYTGTTLSIGTTNATAITIGKAAMTTTVGGALTVTEAGTFSSTLDINGLTTAKGGLVVTNAGNVSFQKGSDYSTVGSQNDVDFGTGALFRLTGLSAQTITGIANGADGRRITLVNAGSAVATIANLSGASASNNQITTGTGGSLSIPVGATIELVYDSSSTVWRVTGGSAATGGVGVNTVGTFSNTSIANGASISGTTITFGAADTTNPGMVSTGTQTFAGNKTFQGTLTVGNATATDDQIITAITTGGAARFTGTVTNADLTSNQVYTLPNATGTVITTGNLTDITTVGTITAGVWNGTALTDTYVSNSITIDSSGSVDWTALTNYPGACTAGQAITQLDDTVTCSAFAVGSAASYIQNQNAGAQTTSNYWISGSGRADVSFLTPLLDTATAAALGVGTGNANAVNISKAGVVTTINGSLTVTEAATFNSDVTIAAGKYLKLTGGNTASRPASPAEGMLYYDSTTKQLLIYANGKWQADRSDSTKIVAASGASQAVKDAADYVATGTGDQTVINTALNAAAGGKVYLTEGTFVANGTILIPSNTTLIGAGLNTVVQLNVGSGSDHLIENKDVPGTGVGIRDMTIDGSLGTGGTQDGVYFDQMSDLSNASLTGLSLGGWDHGNALHLLNSSSLVNFTGNKSTSGIIIDNSVIYNFTGNSLLADLVVTNSASVAVISGNLMTNLSLTTGAVVFNFSGNAAANVSVDNSVMSNIVGNTLSAITLDTSSGTNINGNKINANGVNGITLINSDNTRITSNYVYDQGASGVAISIDATSNFSYISDNEFDPLDINDTSGNSVYGGQVDNLGNFAIQPTGTIELLKNTNITGNLDVSGTLNVGSSNQLQVDASGNLSTSGSLTVTNAGTDITTGTNQDLTVVANGTGQIILNDTVQVGTLGTASNATYICRNASNQFAACNATGTGAAFVQGGNTFGAAADLGTNDAFALNLRTGGTTKAVLNTSGDLAFQQASTVSTTTGALTLTSAAATTWSTSAGNLSLDAAASLNLGASSATAVSVSRTGVTTTINGALTVTQASTFNGNVSVSGSNTLTVGGISRLNGNVGVNIGAATPTADLTFGENGGSGRNINVLTRTTNAAGDGLTIKAGAAGSGASAFAGGVLTLQGGGAGGTGNANGGAVTIVGGAGVGTGTQGLVNLATTAFTSASEQAFATSVSITAGNVDVYSTLPVKATATGLTLTVPDPAQNVIGRLLYISARSGSSDFTMRLNSARTPIDIAMKANSTATLIWNGTDWTAAGASSSTDLQSAYNNTLTSAGGAELVLNASGGAADGFTIRNNGTTPINGGLLEVQSSIGTNLFSVNNYATEYATNGGAETAGGSSTTFPASTWAAGAGGGTVTREAVTAGFIATGQASVKVVTTGSTQGAKDTLSIALTSTKAYQVSFTSKLSTAGPVSTIDVVYSGNGTADNATCVTGQAIASTAWSKITCTFTATGTINSSNAIVIRQSDGTGRTFYIDNLSVTEISTTTTPSNVQIGGGLLGGQPTLFTLDRFSSAPVANGNTTYYGSMYYDTTTGRIQCYESDGWGACGSAPDNIITLTPEYTGAVLNGSGVGVMTADFCANESTVLVVGSLCANHEARSFYRWTSPQATDQTYDVYVNYKLPSTFKGFYDANTIKLTAYKDHATNAGATLNVYRKNVIGNVITQCGSSTTVTTGTGAWNQTALTGDETACGFVAGDYVIFKITVTSKSSGNVYIENLDFTFSNT